MRKDFVPSSLGTGEFPFHRLTKLACIQAVDYAGNIYFEELLCRTSIAARPDFAGLLN